MTYLITEILLCLLAAFVFGFIMGALFFGTRGKNKRNKNKHDTTMSSPSFDDEDDDELPDDDIDIDTLVNLESDAYRIETLEGIGPQTGKLFRGYGVETVGDYLRTLNRPEKREAAAKALDIRVQPIHDWASMADLLRVEGIDHQYAELTYASGIRTVGELAHADPADLLARMETANNAGKQQIAPNAPDLGDIENWIARAKTMKSVVHV